MTEAFSPVKSAERTVALLETLAASPHRMTVGEIQRATGYPRSSLHALLRTLRELRWVEADESGTTFGIGPSALLTGTAYLDRYEALPAANRTLEELREKLGRTVHFARREACDVLYLATRESIDRRRGAPRVGRKLPAYATALGQCLLAELTDLEISALLPSPMVALTPATITDPDALVRAVEATRTRGYAVEHEENTPGVVCVAATVSYRIPATDAISCSLPAAAAEEPGVLAAVAEAVVAATTELATTLRREGVR